MKTVWFLTLVKNHFEAKFQQSKSIFSLLFWLIQKELKPKYLGFLCFGIFQNQNYPNLSFGITSMMFFHFDNKAHCNKSRFLSVSDSVLKYSFEAGKSIRPIRIMRRYTTLDEAIDRINRAINALEADIHEWNVVKSSVFKTGFSHEEEAASNLKSEFDSFLNRSIKVKENLVVFRSLFDTISVN